MIKYHFTWKLDLKVRLRKVERYVGRARESGKEEDFKTASVWVEHFVQHAAFDIRRLRESGHLSDTSWNQHVSVLRFSRKSNGEQADGTLRSEMISKIYDLAQPRRGEIRLEWLCNELIHSAMLLDTVLGDNTTWFNGFVLTSDRFQGALKYVELESFLMCVEHCCNDGFDTPPEIPLAPE